MGPKYATAAKNAGSLGSTVPQTLETNLPLGTLGSSQEGVSAREPGQGQVEEVWVPVDLACFGETPVHCPRPEDGESSFHSAFHF